MKLLLYILRLLGGCLFKINKSDANIQNRERLEEFFSFKKNASPFTFLTMNCAKCMLKNIDLARFKNYYVLNVG